MNHDFEKICAHIRPALLTKAMQLCRNPHAAEDLVQETLLAAYLVWDTFDPADRDPVDRARGWAQRILLNRFRDAYRTQICHATAFENRHEDIVAATMAELRGPGEMLDREGFVEHVDDDLKHAVASLPEDYRDVILRTADGQNDRQIAGELGLDRRNVRHRLWRARRAVRRVLAARAA